MDCPHPEKKAYRSKRVARQAQEKMEARQGIELGLRPYLCACSQWHLGHRSKEPSWARRLRRSL